jgi:lysophospholipase L1-like esterase
MYYLNGAIAPPATERAGSSDPRVSINDYLANLERFRAEAQLRGMRVVFLTRPHKIPADELKKSPSWRGFVPRYNDALVEWAKEQKVALLDIQGIFEQLSPDLFSDECHFTPTGYRRMAELIRDHLLDGPAAAGTQPLLVKADAETTPTPRAALP